MDYKKKYKQDILNKMTPNDCFDELSKKLNLNSAPRENKMKKKGIVIVAGSVCACIAVGIGAYILVGNLNKEESSKLTMVQMNLNPSISFVVDEENKVVSVTGENNEGKMIIAGEKIVGEDLQAAIELVLKVENETGYLVSGNVTADENQLSFSVSVNDEALKSAIENQITTTVNQVCEDLDVKHHITYLQSYSDEKLNELVLSIDSTLTLEEVQAMTYEQKINKIKLYHIETAELYSQELEDLYKQAKEYEITFVESEFTKEAISSMGILYDLYMSGYDIALNLLKTSIDSLNTIRYDQLISEESTYQKAYSTLLDAKAEVLAYKNELAQVETDNTEKQESIMEVLELKEQLLDTLTETLETHKEIAINLIDEAITKIEQAIVSLEEYKATLPNQDEVVATLNNKAKELETKINETKDNMFEKFEEKYAADIEAQKEKVLAYKESLKEPKVSQE